MSGSNPAADTDVDDKEEEDIEDDDDNSNLADISEDSSPIS